MKFPWFGRNRDRQIEDAIEKKVNPLLRLMTPMFTLWGGLTPDSDFSAMMKAYKSWVYVCSTRNAQSVAQSTLRLYMAKPKASLKTLYPTKAISSDQKHYLLNTSIANIPAVKKAVDFEEVLEHPILNLFRNVNAFINSFDLWEITELYQELTGNAYWLLLSNNTLGIPDEIWPIPPDKVKIIPDPTKFITGYRYQSGAFDHTFSEKEIIHFKFPNPNNYYYGCSPLSAVTGAYNIGENMDRYEAATFRNMGRMEGYWKAKESLSEEDFKRLKQELMDATIGVEKANKSFLVDNDIDYKTISFAPREMAYLEGRKISKETIFNAYGLPLGLYSENSTRANADQATYNYAKNTVMPRCMRLAEKLNEKLVPMYDERLFLQWDNVVPEDQKMALQVRTENVKSGITAINEERKKLRMPPFEGCDEPFMQVQYAPISQIVSGTTIAGTQPAAAPTVPPEKPPTTPPKEPKDMVDVLTKQLVQIIAQKLQSHSQEA